MSKLETNTIDTISGSTTLTLGGTNATTIAQDSATTITGLKSTGIDDNATSTAITIDSSENVGIGTTSPGTKLEVVGTGVNGIELGQQSDGNDSSRLFLTNSTNVCAIRSTGGAIKFSTGATINSSSGDDRFIIDSGGGVGINSTPDSNNFLLKVTHDGNSKYALNANSSNASGTQYHIVFQRNGSTAGYITSNSATTIAFNNASDERLKENIQNSNSAIQDIKDMQVRQFDWVDAIDTHKDFGFVAQELVNVVPEAVTQGTDELDDNGKPVRSWGVDYSHIVPRLVKVCQEQQTKIEDLEARLTVLENA